MSNVTLKVNFGQRESVQVIHVDRKRPQTLVWETDEGQTEETLQEQEHTCSGKT